MPFEIKFFSFKFSPQECLLLAALFQPYLRLPLKRCVRLWYELGHTHIYFWPEALSFTGLLYPAGQPYNAFHVRIGLCWKPHHVIELYRPPPHFKDISCSIYQCLFLNPLVYHLPQSFTAGLRRHGKARLPHPLYLLSEPWIKCPHAHGRQGYGNFFAGEFSLFGLYIIPAWQNLHPRVHPLFISTERWSCTI